MVRYNHVVNNQNMASMLENAPAGSISSSLDGRVTKSREEVCAFFQELLEIQCEVAANGIYVGDTGVVNVIILPHNGHIRVLGSVLSNSENILKVNAFMDANLWVKPIIKGIQNINIEHYYLDKTRTPEGELRTQSHYRTTEDFKYLSTDMYPRIDIAEMMRQYSLSDESLAIISGLPGTGKTCFSKMMMAQHALTQECDISVVYVKDREILAKDSFWATMSSEQPAMIILDDLDNELIPRTEGDGNPIVSNMLSYSDGIFDVDTKIIITTNLTDSRIDKALVRPGRAFDALSLPQLNREEARNIWVDSFKAPVEEFESRFEGLDIISQAAVVSEHQRFLKSEVPTYLRDKSISIRKLVEDGCTIEPGDGKA